MTEEGARPHRAAGGARRGRSLRRLRNSVRHRSAPWHASWSGLSHLVWTVRP